MSLAFGCRPKNRPARQSVKIIGERPPVLCTALVNQMATSQQDPASPATHRNILEIFPQYMIRKPRQKALKHQSITDRRDGQLLSPAPPPKTAAAVTYTDPDGPTTQINRHSSDSLPAPRPLGITTDTHTIKTIKRARGWARKNSTPSCVAPPRPCIENMASMSTAYDASWPHHAYGSEPHPRNMCCHQGHQTLDI